MGVPQPPSTPPHLYPEELQLKLYQAFIFSIPILFSIILILLFYLFYLKRRASSYSATPSILPRTMNEATSSFTAPLEVEKKPKGEQNNLSKVVFDDDIKTKESLCCVCLGEFQMKEELLQVPACKHVFHIDCIRHWLRSNSTCPLCRSSTLAGYPQPSTLQLSVQHYSNDPSIH